MRTDAHVNRSGHGWRLAGWWALCAVIVLSVSTRSRAQEINTDALDESTGFPRTSTSVDRLPGTATQTNSSQSPAGATLGSATGSGTALPIRVPTSPAAKTSPPPFRSSSSSRSCPSPRPS